MARALKRFYVILVYAFFYLPLVVMFVYSFNNNKYSTDWRGLTLRWYETLFNNSAILDAALNSVLVAVCAASLATLLGSLAALSVKRYRFPGRRALYVGILLLTVSPDIVMGVSLMILFIALRMRLGFNTMLIAHITFDTPYVIFSVMPRLKRMNPHLYEAALDLGATPAKALRSIILPEIRPGIITGALLSFTLSLDDFVVSFFTSNTPNLSVLVYSMARKGITPSINALSTVMFAAILILLMIVNKRVDLETL